MYNTAVGYALALRLLTTTGIVLIVAVRLYSTLFTNTTGSQ
jgi:hypothetical protein